jgi:hypothetical protein
MVEERFLFSPIPLNPYPDANHTQPTRSSCPESYAAGNQSAVWRAGEAFIKPQDLRDPKRTREHVTLEFLQGKKPLDFKIPNVLYHGEWDGRYYIIVSRVPGRR